MLHAGTGNQPKLPDPTRRERPGWPPAAQRHRGATAGRNTGGALPQRIPARCARSWWPSTWSAGASAQPRSRRTTLIRTLAFSAGAEVSEPLALPCLFRCVGDATKASGNRRVAGQEIGHGGGLGHEEGQDARDQESGRAGEPKGSETGPGGFARRQPVTEKGAGPADLPLLRSGLTSWRSYPGPSCSWRVRRPWAAGRRCGSCCPASA